MQPRHKTSKKSAGSPRAASRPPAAPFTNLEMQGDHLKVFSLQTLLTNKKNPQTRDAARLGDVLLPWFEKMVIKPSEKFGGITELWNLLVPDLIAQRSRLVAFHRGTLTVALDSATVRAELDGKLRGGLLRSFQTQSRGAIFRIKTCVQPLPPPDP